MRTKKLLAAFLLGVGLCFVPVLGYGEVKKFMAETKEVSNMNWYLLKARVNYVMRNPTTFSDVSFHYDAHGVYGRTEKFPKSVDTIGKIYVTVYDRRGVFSYKSGIALLDEFKKQLKVIYSFIIPVATNMDTDIVAKFYSRGDIPLGYFYQGEYHLWEK